MTEFSKVILQPVLSNQSPSSSNAFDMQVQIGTHSFTFDHVYGGTGSPTSAMFEECVASLVDGLFQGYNATVLAYGQVK